MPIGVASDPRYILDELGGTNSREAHPQPAVVQRKHAAAPPQNLSRLSAHLVQVYHLFNLQGFPAGDYDVTIDGGEIDSISDNVAVVRFLDRDIYAGTRVGQTNRVALLKACYPDVLVKLKHVIRV